MQAWGRQSVGFNQSCGFTKRKKLERGAEESRVSAKEQLPQLRVVLKLDNWGSKNIRGLKDSIEVVGAKGLEVLMRQGKAEVRYWLTLS